MKMTDYAKRRKALAKKIGNEAVAIIPSNAELIRSADTHYAFRQNSNFSYLSGFEEPDAVMVLIPKRKGGEYILFNRPKNREKEIWDGPRVGQAGACKEYLADEAYPIETFDEMLPGLLEGKDAIYYPVGLNHINSVVMNALNTLRSKIRTGVTLPSGMFDVTSLLHEMRLIKTPEEIALMQKAVDITAAAHIKAMQVCKPQMNEYELEAIILYECAKRGARYQAYIPIVGSGENTCILHYNQNNKTIRNGDLVLIDAGCEYQNYASDITRTFPANGKFTAEQKAVYEIVLASQLAAIATIKPGKSWTEAQDVIVKIITQGLVDLGLLKGSVDSLIEKEAYFPFYMHRSGHWLGLDVHDVGNYKQNNRWRPLKAGMTLTVEPGIYISKNIPGVHKRWHNIGIRIEDDILVTPKGHDVMSKAIPKTVADIEALMQGK